MNKIESHYAARAQAWIESGDVTIDLATSAIERIVFQLKHQTTPKEKINDIQSSLIILREWVSENVSPELFEESDADEFIAASEDTIEIAEVDFANSNLRYDEPEIDAPLTGESRMQRLKEILQQSTLITRGAHNLKSRTTEEKIDV